MSSILSAFPHYKAPPPVPEVCDETYGLFPCSTSLPGSVFLVFVYGLFLLKGANLISDGSELLLAVLDPGLIGGLVLPVLGALPDSAMIVMSGMGGTVEEAQEQVAVGIGTLAGSTIMLLSIAWGGSLWLGRCDLNERGVAINKKLQRPYDMFRTGVTTDTGTRVNSYIMVGSAFFYLFPQIPSFMGYTHATTAAGIGGFTCLLGLAAYCAFQVMWPKFLQQRKISAAAEKQRRAAVKYQAVQFLNSHGKLMDSDGNVNETVLRELFNSIDKNGDKSIDKSELKLLMEQLKQKANPHMPLRKIREEIEKDFLWMLKELDTDGNNTISFEELKAGVNKWFNETRPQRLDTGDANEATPLVGAASFDEEAGEGDNDEEDEEEEDEEPLTHAQILKKATLLLFGGALMVALFSDPMVDAVSEFSKASKIPTFFVAFIITPFASNASELVSSLQFAKKKKIKNISLTYSQVYGAVTMNNTMCLGLFLLVVWHRGLEWTFSSEVVTIMTCIFLLGIITSTRLTFPTYFTFVSLMLYPFALGLVFFLDFSLGWK